MNKLATSQEIPFEEDLDEGTGGILEYKITSYGADFDIYGLVRRLQKEDIIIPKFQRNYVWGKEQASKLIESVFMGLPIPGIFLARDTKTQKLIVIDGQQRLLTFQYFVEGKFPQKNVEFILEKVNTKYVGKKYNTLDAIERRLFDDSLIHATIIKQDSPEEEHPNSLFQIFERLNTGGSPLTAQEIRNAVYRGDLSTIIHDLYLHPNYTKLIGSSLGRLKDQELVLRFFAFLYDIENYNGEMKLFLNNFITKHTTMSVEQIERFKSDFKQTFDFIHSSFPEAVFKPKSQLNSALFESLSVYVAKNLASLSNRTSDEIINAYSRLLSDEEFQSAISTSTGAINKVLLRHKKVKDIFDAL